MNDASEPSCSLTPPPDSPLDSAVDPSGEAPEATLVYDGDCGFCARTVRHLRWHTGPSLEIVPYQAALERFPDTPAEEFAGAVHLFEADGKKSKGAEAGLRALARLPGWKLPLWLYRKIGPVRKISDWGYRLIAKNRFKISSWTTRLFGPPPLRRGQTLTRRVFELALGTTLFVSLVEGTSKVGSEFITPTWTLAGVGLGLLLLWRGILPKLFFYSVLIWWAVMPVISNVDAPPAHAEWYMLEALFYAGLYAAPAWTARRAEKCEPSIFGLVLLRLLTLRVMMDWVPWTEGQRAEIPGWLQAVTWTFPLLVFGPRRLRVLGAVFLVLFQVASTIRTGFGWENLFVITMAIPLLDDAVLLRYAPSKLRKRWLERLPLFRATLHRQPILIVLTIIAFFIVLATRVSYFTQV